MQTRSRANGSSTGHGKSGKDKSSRYQKTFACLSKTALIFLLSCATTSTRTSKLSSEFKNLCLSGEGHGRISFLSGRHRFDYESLTTPEKKEWALAFHYPGIGEKLVKLDYGRPQNQGDFLDKLLVEIQDEKLSKNYREVLREFFHRLSLVVQTHVDFNQGNKGLWQCHGKSCSYQDIKMTWSLKSNKFRLLFPLSNEYVFHLEAFSKEKYFTRMRIFVQKEKDLGIKRNPLELMLFLNTCYQK